jgi:hypothetical protein
VKTSISLTVALSLTAVLLFYSQGSAQSEAPTTVRGTPLQIAATTTPKRDRFRPYTFTTRGRIVPPPRHCAPGANPTPGAGYCLPILCPPGTTDIDYCRLPGRSVICTGTVTVRLEKINTTISSHNVAVRPDCTYRSTTTFRQLAPTRRGNLRVRALFRGNPVLQPKNSSTHIVRAG